MAPRWSFASSFTVKVVLPSLLAVSALAVLLFYMVNGIFQEMNRLDSKNAKWLARSAVTALRTNLENVIYDNAVWDDAVKHAGSAVDVAWVDRTWGEATALGVYDAAFLVDENGATLYAAHLGKHASASAREFFGADFDVLLANLASAEPGRSVSGLLRSPGGASAVSASRIVPVNYDAADSQGARNRLVLSRSIDNTVLARIAQSYAMENLRFAEGSSAPGDEAIHLISPTGENIAALTWTSHSPGNVVRDMYGSVITMILMMFLFVVVVLLYMSWKGFKEAHDSQVEAVSASLRDDLTGLANRRQFLSVLNSALERARARRLPLSLVYADLDGFKEVNDSYGHEIGDMLLKAVAAGFAHIGQDTELIARLGGDEFAMIITGEGSAGKARSIATTMIAFLAEPMVFDGRIASVTLSAGIVDCEDDGADVEEFIRRADVAMYAAKSNGRNRYHVYHNALDFKRDENRSIASQLREHIDKRNLTVVYQPVVDAKSRIPRGVEALVRWPADAPCQYSPDQFIPVAEEFGLIEDLGRFVMSEACRQAARWQDIFVAVNVSPTQFMNPSFADIVEVTLKGTGLDPSRLEIEVTEGFIIDNAARASAIINRLRDMKVSVALDDFGTGFSSIGHLRRFKFDKLKLDRSMVSDILRQPSALRLVQGTIAMADALGLSVVAEGIEHENQVSVLRLAGCSMFQGFLYSSPVTADEITAYLEQTKIALAG